MDTIPSLINNYHPNIDSDAWSAMRDYVCATVTRRYAPGRSPEVVHNALCLLAGFGDWVSFTGLGALDETTLSEDVIDAYTAFRISETTGPVTERERKVLRTLAGLPNKREHSRTTTSLPPQEAYSPAEVMDIRRWAHFQPTRLRQRDCAAIVAFAMGCGLTTGEMVTVRGRDLLTLDDGMAAVAAAGRIVPATAAFSDDLQSLESQSPDAYVIAPRAGYRKQELVTGIVRRSVGMRPLPQRMRSTWLLQHIDAGTPLNNLMQAAGLEGVDFLRRLLPFAATLDGAAAVSALRLGAEVAR